MDNLLDLLEGAVRQKGGGICVRERFGGSIADYSYSQIRNESIAVAAWLKAHNFGNGQRAVVMLENRHEWIACYFGILYAGGIAVPIDVQASENDVRYIINETKSVFCFAGVGQNTGGLEKLLKFVKIGSEGEYSYRGILSSSEKPPLPKPLTREDVASIIYTSGTTGRPKGVMLTHGNFLANLNSIDRFRIATDKDALLSILPLHHTYPFTITMLLPIFALARITFLDTLKGDPIFNTIRDDGITMLVVTPQVLALFYKAFNEKISASPASFIIRGMIHAAGFIRRLTGKNAGLVLFGSVHKRLGKQFRFFVSGGAKLDENIARFFYKIGFTVIEGYGLTETSPVVSFNPTDKQKIGSVGKALPEIEVAIKNAGETNSGEILVRGKNVMKGYYLRESETREALEGGWFHTGDLGRIDSEGYVYITGRIKEIIVLSSGKNISPAELEKHYSSSKLIKEIAVLADSKQEKLAALIVPEIAEFKKTGESNIRARLAVELGYLSEELPSYQRIRDFAVISEELPKTRLGKIKRFMLEDIYKKLKSKQGIHAEHAKAELSEAGNKIMGVIKRETGILPSPDDLLEIDLGLDSLGKVALMTALEEKLNITLPEEEFYKLYRVGDLIDYIEQKKFPENTTQKKGRMWNEILAQAPQDSLKRNIGLTTGALSGFFTFLAAVLLRIFFGLFFRLSVHGKENIPPGGAIISPNHTSYLDGILVYASVPLCALYKLHFLGYRAYFEAPVVRHFIKFLRVIPVDPSHNLVDAMKASAYVIKNRKNICIFPEGARSVSGEIMDFKEGVGILSHELNIPVVPVYIEGAHSALKPGSIFPKPRKISIFYGKPADPDKLRRMGHIAEHQASNYRAITIALKREIVNLKDISL